MSGRNETAVSNTVEGDQTRKAYVMANIAATPGGAGGSSPFGR